MLPCVYNTNFIGKKEKKEKKNFVDPMTFLRCALTSLTGPSHTRTIIASTLLHKSTIELQCVARSPPRTSRRMIYIIYAFTRKCYSVGASEGEFYIGGFKKWHNFVATFGRYLLSY